MKTTKCTTCSIEVELPGGRQMHKGDRCYDCFAASEIEIRSKALIEFMIRSTSPSAVIVVDHSSARLLDADTLWPEGMPAE